MTASKREAIFTSTLQLIQEFGFHGTPMSQIAQNAGVATGTIYHYFPSKESLLIELFQYCKEKISTEIFKPTESELSYPDQFSTIWINLVEHYIQHPEILSFMEQFFSSPFIKSIYPDNCVFFQDEIPEFLRQGVQAGYIKPIEINIISAAYFGTVAATAKQNINGRFPIKKDDLKKLVAIIWDGIKNELTK